MYVELSPELETALDEYKEAFLHSYPLEREYLGSAEKNVVEIRRRIRENDPARPWSAEELTRRY